MNSYFAAELVKTRQTGLAAEASRARPRSSAPSARLAAPPPMELTSEGRTCCLAHFNAHRAIYSPQVPPAEAGTPGA